MIPVEDTRILVLIWRTDQEHRFAYCRFPQEVRTARIEDLGDPEHHCKMNGIGHHAFLGNNDKPIVRRVAGGLGWRRRRRHLLLLAPVFTMLYLPWAVLRWTQIPFTHENFPDSLSIAYAMEKIQRLGFILPRLLYECISFERWHLSLGTVFVDAPSHDRRRVDQVGASLSPLHGHRFFRFLHPGVHALLLVKGRGR